MGQKGKVVHDTGYTIMTSFSLALLTAYFKSRLKLLHLLTSISINIDEIMATII